MPRSFHPVLEVVADIPGKSCDKWIEGPTAMILSTIDEPTAAELEEYKDAVEHAVGGYAFGRWAFAKALFDSANKPEPPEDQDDMAKWLVHHPYEHRMLTRMRAMLCCDDDGRVGMSALTDLELSHGFTPVRILGLTLWYSPGEGSAQGEESESFESLGVRARCKSWYFRNMARIGSFARNAGYYGFNLTIAPMVWNAIRYTLCCDGRRRIEFWGSHFPSHRAYIDGALVGTKRADAQGLLALLGTPGTQSVPGDPAPFFVWIG